MPAHVNIVGTALVSALGQRGDVACAAARAGMRRTRRSRYAVHNAELEREFLSVHPSYPLTHGFSGELRLIRMLQRALRDLWHDDCVPAGAEARRVGFYLAMPAQQRDRTALAWIADDELRSRREARAKASPERIDCLQRGRELVRRACQLAGIEPNWHVTRSIEGGHGAVAECVDLAMADLQVEGVDLAIVGGVDSLLDHATLRWLEETARLKTPAIPVGLEPAEACGLLLLEAREATFARGGRPLAAIAGLARAVDDKPYRELEPATGAGHTKLLAQLSAIAGWSDADVPWLIVDQNGEVGRASDWAHALARVQAAQPWFANARTSYPAASFGDSCAASGAVNACFAVNAFARRWAFAPSVAVVSAGDCGIRAGLLLRGESS